MTGIEEWRNIPSLPNYEVSSVGRVRHKTRKRIRTPLVSKGGTQRGEGYLSVNVFMAAEGRNRHFAVHRLVCEAFHGPCPLGHQCAHNNGIRNDNRPENLRWVTAIENAEDKQRHGTTVRGAKHKLAKLAPSDIQAILAAAAQGASSGELGRKFGVSRQVIWRIKCGTSYAGEGVIH